MTGQVADSTVSGFELPAGEPGLTSAQAAAERTEHGANTLVPRTHRNPFLDSLGKSLREPMVLLLIAAAAIYVAIGDELDAIVTAAAVIPILAVSMVLEYRSARALERLRELTAAKARVLRDGTTQALAAEDLVPGDVIFVQEGDVVPADLRLLQGANLVADESALTGESLPVEKAVDGDDVLKAGTTLLSGRGSALVRATGRETEYGRIGGLVAETKETPTPLEQSVHRMTYQVLAVAVLFCLLVAGVELSRGRGLGAALIAGVSLAIAAVPEEFPMVYTLYLSLGAWRLSKENVLVRRLAGVEALGAASVICSDKTGTLTAGQLTLAELRPVGPSEASGSEDDVLQAALLACEPDPFDPLEVQIVKTARTHGLQVGDRSLARDYGFDPKARYMSHVWSLDGGFEIAAKGALEGILAHSQVAPDVAATAERANAALAARGMRVLGVAGGPMSSLEAGRGEDEAHLRFLGLIAFSDPLRPGVTEAISECKTAGIRVVMITGDHPVTALAVAQALGLDQGTVATGRDLEAADQLATTAASSQVFARISPEQKYVLVKELRRGDAVVAMTGDGINDAPALREADIGVAMGQRGTEVAREAATLVLLDDNFATIVSAVREGRRIFKNLQRAFAYLIAFHIPLVLSAFVIPLLGAPLFLLPIHLVLLELFIHPAVSIVFEEAPPPAGVMREAPRPRSAPLLGREAVVRSVAEGLALAAGVIILYLWQWRAGSPVTQARTMAFVALLAGEIALLLIERARPESIWQALPHLDRLSIGVVLCTILGVAALIYVPPLAHLFQFEPISPTAWLLATAIGVVAIFWAEVGKRPRAAGDS